ncbi:hypothetical protein [Tichowtungia aerotolerans]|uniref:Uncharacterized protein n=1 Tax=Tichowtungia aerotolerans TaxID=2697043 RepID=A0A6P1M2A8_9BACT|nr:hypothetical protein [Tichowtungia aerotolerans]QHI67967.1 hypothetical protein GT409_00390 [Tichowtungia aerotolerans]
MSMSGIAKYMHLSQTIDLRRDKERYLRLPDGRASRTMLMTEKQAATFSAACSRRVLGTRLAV